MRLRVAAVSLALGAWSAAAPAAAEPRFDVIEPLDGGSLIEALATSPDGCLVAGRSGDDGAFSWRNGVSTPLIDLMHQNPQVVDAISGLETMVGVDAGGQAFLWNLYPNQPPFLSLPEVGYLHPTAGYDVEFGADPEWGLGVVGVAGDEGGLESHPYYWNLHRGARILPGGEGEARVLSNDGAVAGGFLGNQAALWRVKTDGPPQLLGALPGDEVGQVRGLSGNGAVAVGSSRSGGTERAFIWSAANGMLELASGTHVANGVTADGTRVVGEADLPGSDGQTAFLWDAKRGARPLAQALRDEYGIDVGEFRLLEATAISPDGKTIVGRGVDASNAVRGWRARLREEPCPTPTTAVDLFASYDMDPEFDDAQGLAVDTQGRAFVGFARTGNVARVDSASPGSPPAELLAFPGGSPSVLGLGPDDSVYLGVYAPKQVLRIRSGGAVEVALDLSNWPPLDIPADHDVGTMPADVAVASDGTLFVAAQARVLRVDPDGSVHELIDVPTAQALTQPSYFGRLSRVALGSDGRLFVATQGNAVVFTLDAQTGAVLAPPVKLAGYLWNTAPDPTGGFWAYGEGLTHVDGEGHVQPLYARNRIPDGYGGVLERIYTLAGDAQGNAYYVGDGYGGLGGNVVRLSPGGAATPVVTHETLLDGESLGGLIPRALQIAGGALYAVEDTWDFDVEICDYEFLTLCDVYNPHPPHLLRVALPADSACSNGLDDDGDGAADFPADKGCLSAQDEGERSFDFPCDNGIDDDHDGTADFPADPGCVSLVAAQEATECDDGLDNDGDGNVDWDGGAVAAPPDAECSGDPRAVIEHPWYCGLGFEVAIVVLPLTQAARKWRQRQRAASTSQPGLDL
jgi:hypothetical protein